MTTAQGIPVVLPPLDASVKKMEDRKRTLANDADDLAPSRKRMIKDENGQQMRMDAEKEKDVENYQKDAILRQMKEYKRQKRDAEERLNDVTQKSTYHDDHLRTIDAWFAQMLDEVQVLTRSVRQPPACPPTGKEMYNSALLFENNDLFKQHLDTRSEQIKATISTLYSQSHSSPNEDEIRAQLNEKLAQEKERSILLAKAIDEKESLEVRLENASLRYMAAEKKLERAKSSQVLKLERAAMMGGNGDASSPATSKKATPPKTEHGETNGELQNGVATAEAEAAMKEAIAAAEKQKAQLEEVEMDNERLTNELSSARTKLASLSDDDYAETTLFKTVKTQLEEAVKRVNDLLAQNIELQEETKKMQADRTSHKMRVDDEFRVNLAESEAQIARAENDLARIRDQRDEYHAELTVRRQADDNRRTSADQAKELAAAKDSKIAALEAEIERLKLRVGDAEPPGMDLDNEDAEALKKRLRTLEGEYAILTRETKAIEDAFSKASASSARKVEDAAAWEESKNRLIQDKGKADQKYFATMKAKDTLLAELRYLKVQNQRSSEIVSQLKDADSKTRELVANLEKQLAEAKDAVAKLETMHRTLEQKAKTADLVAQDSNKKIEELKALVTEKDKEALGRDKGKREAEEELERSKARLDDAKKQVEILRKAKSGAASGGVGGEDDWRKVAICPVCNTNIRNTALKLCGHTFCSACVKDLISNRSRKCPSCGRAFGNGDHMPIVLT